MSKPIILKGWKYGLFISGIVGAIAITLYPITVYPMLHVEEYKQIQERNRRGIPQEEVQPGNMKVWSDPFGKKN